MNNSDDLMATYRAMNQDGRDRLRSVARHMLKRFPSEKQPSLSLVQNGNNIKSLDSVINGSIDHSPIVSTGEAVHSQ